MLWADNMQCIDMAASGYSDWPMAKYCIVTVTAALFIAGAL